MPEKGRALRAPPDPCWLVTRPSTLSGAQQPTGALKKAGRSGGGSHLLLKPTAGLASVWDKLEALRDTILVGFRDSSKPGKG